MLGDSKKQLCAAPLKIGMGWGKTMGKNKRRERETVNRRKEVREKGSGPFLLVGGGFLRGGDSKETK